MLNWDEARIKDSRPSLGVKVTEIPVLNYI